MEHNSTVPLANIPHNFMGYDPNRPAAYVAGAIFGVLMIIVGAHNIKFRSWFFMVVPIASAMEMVGFFIRPDAAYTMGKFIPTTLCILLSPTIFAMADYALISKM
jgi:hypothetical protein